MGVRFVFTRNDKSFISRAIMWFEQRRIQKERRCSHGMYVFFPSGPVFKDNLLAFEAMERGVWMNIYEKALGKQTVVAEFELDIGEVTGDKITIEVLEKYLDWYYDFVGVGENALWILLKRWAGTLVRWFDLVFRPGKAGKALFCTGLLWEIAKVTRKHYPERDWTGGVPTAREATPKAMIDVCFAHPECYKYRGGTAEP